MRLIHILLIPIVLVLFYGCEDAVETPDPRPAFTHVTFYDPVDSTPHVYLLDTLDPPYVRYDATPYVVSSEGTTSYRRC